MSELKKGTLLDFGRYRILKKIGSGGFSYVYLAEDIKEKKYVAIKESFSPNKCIRDNNAKIVNGRIDKNSDKFDSCQKRFVDEYNMLKNMIHPNIVRVYDLFEDNHTYYYTMEYIEGKSLNEYIKHENGLKEQVAVNIIREVCKAISDVHNHNICHYDINPNNILLRKGTMQPILIDFGLAKKYKSKDEKLDNSYRTLTIAYSPLELFEKDGMDYFSPQSDIFSLGATLYTAIIGSPPPSLKEIWHGALKENVKKMSLKVQNAIIASMQIIKDNRPSDVGAFVNML